MSPGVTFSDLLAYTEWERDKWVSRFKAHGPHALAIGVGPHGDGRFATVGEMIRHIFSAELRYVERLSQAPLSNTASVPADNADALFRFGQESRGRLRTFITSYPAETWDAGQEFALGKHVVTATPRKIVLHILAHEMKHWAQIAALLRREGLTGDFHDALFGPDPGSTLMPGPAAHRPPEVIGVAPQFLVGDLLVATEYYRDKLGFATDFVYQSFYASVSRDGFSIHLKCAPKTASDRTHRKQNEHLDAYISVRGIEALFMELQAKGARIIRSLAERPWARKEFYVEDPDGYLLCFSEESA